MVNSGIRTSHLRRPNPGDSGHMYYTRQQLCGLELSASWAISGKRKKRQLLNWIISFRKKFLAENNKHYMLDGIDLITTMVHLYRRFD